MKSVIFSSKHDVQAMFIIGLTLLIKIFFLGQYDLFAEEAYYWNYSTHLDWSYLDHPAMVALLIKASTWLFGINEFAVRFPALICWIITAYFSYRWSEQISKNSGIFTLTLLALLPFFFLFTLVMTPDLPLIACWSASLFYLYRALCCEQSNAWYYAGLAIGLGFLSKYTIVLLIFTTTLYCLLIPDARRWFSRKEPYLATIIIILLSTPVFYWNATHDWVSFAFQSTRRLQSSYHFSLPALLGLLILFLTPMGILGTYRLIIGSKTSTSTPSHSAQQFMRLYFLIPLLVFISFSFTRDIKCNWIGPSLLALLPWLSTRVQHHAKQYRPWCITYSVLLVFYVTLLYTMTYGKPVVLSQALLSKYIDWNQFTQQFRRIAKPLEKQGQHPVFVALDSYSIISELMFYQTKWHAHHPEQTIYPVHGANFLGYNGLMFEQWTQQDLLSNRTMIIIGKLPSQFEASLVKNTIKPETPVFTIQATNQTRQAPVKPYYYMLAHTI